jgi:Mannose-6-phosphate isomerase
MRTVITTAVVVLAFGAGWLAKTSAQQKAPAPLITYFSHDKVDASFAQALGSTGSRDLFARKDRQGQTWAIHSNSRGKSDEGKLHSHEDWTGVVVIMSGAATFITPGTEDWTGVVVIMSGAATFITPGTASTVRGPRDTSEGGSLIGAGESHRVGKGDVVIIPPNAPHMYKNIEEPFRYLVIQTP